MIYSKKKKLVIFITINILLIGITSIIFVSFLNSSNTYNCPNRTPVLNLVSPSSNPIMEEGELLVLNVNVSDPDGDILLYDWYINNTPIECNSNSYNFIPDEFSDGIYIIHFNISDGEYFLEHSWIITVENIPHMVEDIFPGPNDSYPSELTTFKGILYFKTNYGINGVELWMF